MSSSATSATILETDARTSGSTAAWAGSRHRHRAVRERPGTW
jgi:hypothetical protein